MMPPYPAFFTTLGLFLTGSGTLFAQASTPGDSVPPRRSSVVIRQSGQGNSATVIQSGGGKATTIVSSSDGTNTTTVHHDGQSSVTIEQSGGNQPDTQPTKGQPKSRKHEEE